MGPCGISCALCSLGNGTVAEMARKLKEYIDLYGLPSWAHMTPGGAELNFDHLMRALDWMYTYAMCLGCEQGGGPPECPHQELRKGKGICPMQRVPRP